MIGSNEEKFHQLIQSGRELRLWRHGFGYKHYCRHQLFPQYDFTGKTMLEIGAGSGTYSLWASVMGAKEVIALEPSKSGSDETSCVHTFRSLVKRLELTNITILEQTLQEYASTPDRFDMILSHYSINHLQEEYCVMLREDPPARGYYIDLFKKLSALVKPGGSVIIVDCTNRSFYSDIGFVNPFSPTIEWFKHYPPSVWIELMRDAGFHSPRVTWIYDNRLMHAGAMLKNRLAAYFYTSMFRIEMMK